MPQDSQVESATAKASNMRWIVCFLLLAALAINYVHRQMFGVLKGTLSTDLGWSETDYSNIVFWFQAAYALGYVSFGRFLDRFGARVGYAIAFAVWTVSHTLTAFVTSTFQFTIARIALGLGESGSFPSSIKAVTDWFPQRERALATGVFNAGAAIGAIIAPLVVPMIALTASNFDFGDIKIDLPGLGLGWRGAFLVTGLVSMVWVFLWWAVYRKPAEHKSVNAAELAMIQSDKADHVDKVPWFKLLFVRETWVYAGAKFLIDPIWWLYLFWLPDFLGKTYGLDLKNFGPPLIAIYLLSDVGSVSGGWLSSFLLKRGLSVNVARKATLFVFALMVVPMLFAQGISNLWLAVLVIGIAAAAHQAFSANVYTLPSDLFPRSAVGSVIGIGGTAGAIGGMIMSKCVGPVLQAAKDAGHESTGYAVIFSIAAFTYLVAFAFIHLMSPKLKRNETVGL